MDLKKLEVQELLNLRGNFLENKTANEALSLIKCFTPPVNNRVPILNVANAANGIINHII